MEETLRKSKLKESGTNILWIDHHIWSTEWIDEIGKLAKLHIDTKNCSAKITSKVVCGGTGFSNEFSEAICSADLWRFDHPYASWLYRYVAACGKRYSRVLNKFFDLLRSRNFIDSEVIEKVKNTMDIELKLLKKYKRSMTLSDICGYKVALLLKKSSIPQTSIIANYISSITNADIVTIINMESCSLSLRSRRVNVQKIAKALGGGGHPQAAGARLRLGIIRCSLLRLGIDIGIIKLVKELLKRAICSSTCMNMR